MNVETGSRNRLRGTRTTKGISSFFGIVCSFSGWSRFRSPIPVEPIDALLANYKKPEDLIGTLDETSRVSLLSVRTGSMPNPLRSIFNRRRQSVNRLSTRSLLAVISLLSRSTAVSCQKSAYTEILTPSPVSTRYWSSRANGHLNLLARFPTLGLTSNRDALN